LLELLIDEHKIEKAETRLIDIVAKHCKERIQAKLGYQGGYENCLLYWCQQYHLYFYSKRLFNEPIPRYWNALGLSHKRPKKNQMLDITVEINPPIKGLNKFVQGAFARDEHRHIWLLHRGKIGGGKKGIGRELFYRNFKGKITKIGNDNFAVIGSMEQLEFIRDLTKFVTEVNGIKAL
jgi:hypothetical protein